MTAIMSLREPFQRDGIWYYEIDRKRLSLKTKDRDKAHRLFRAIQKEYLNGSIVKITGDCPSSLKDFTDEVLAHMEAASPENSWRSMRSTIRRLLPVAGSNTRLDRLSPKHWDQFLAECNRSSLAAKSIRTYQLQLRILMGKAVSWGLLKADPWAKCKLVKEEAKPPAFLEPDDVGIFINGIADPDVRFLAALLVFTGRRIGEVMLLEWQDFDFQAMTYKAWMPKAKKAKTFPMHPVLLDVLLPVRKDIGRVVTRWKHTCNASHAVKKALIAAGHGHLHAHDLRHTFASIVIMSGNDLKVAQELLGHGSYKSTLRYAHLTPSAVAAGLARVQFAYSVAGKPGNTPSEK